MNIVIYRYLKKPFSKYPKENVCGVFLSMFEPETKPISHKNIQEVFHKFSKLIFEYKFRTRPTKNPIKRLNYEFFVLFVNLLK